MARFRHVEEERYEVLLGQGERDLLARLPGELRALIEDDGGPVARRLFPRAYLDHTEEAAEEEWQRLMRAELLEKKLAGLELLAGTLERAEERRGGGHRVELEGEEVSMWLGVLNDARLALGTLLEVTPDLDIARISPDDPQAPMYHLYGWLTWTQGRLVEALDPPRSHDPF